MGKVKVLNKFKFYSVLFILSNTVLVSCASPYQPNKTGPTATPNPANNWLKAEQDTFNNQCTSEMSVLRLDLDQRMILQYCSCALSQIQERYTFQQLRIDSFNDPQIGNIDQVCTIEANLPPDPADFGGGPSFGGLCDNQPTYEDKIICLGLPAPVLPNIPWRK
jgi:hypothetical protein